MDNKRYYELTHYSDAELTEEEMKEWWFCICEWDGMLIHKDDYEAEVCSCHPLGGSWKQEIFS